MSNATRCPRCSKGTLYYEIEVDETPAVACLLCHWRQEGVSAKQRRYERELAQLAPEIERGRGRPSRSGVENSPRAQAERRARLVVLARQGLSNGQIAAAVGLSESTVSHLRNEAGVGSHPQRARKRAVSASPPRAGGL